MLSSHYGMAPCAAAACASSRTPQLHPARLMECHSCSLLLPLNPTAVACASHWKPQLQLPLPSYVDSHGPRLHSCTAPSHFVCGCCSILPPQPPPPSGLNQRKLRLIRSCSPITPDGPDPFLPSGDPFQWTPNATMPWVCLCVQPSSLGDAVQGNTSGRQPGPATAAAAAASWQTLWGATPSWASNTGQSLLASSSNPQSGDAG